MRKAFCRSRKEFHKEVSRWIQSGKSPVIAGRLLYVEGKIVAECTDRRGGFRRNAGRKNEGRIPVSFRILPGTMEILDRIAKEKKVTRTQVIEEALRNINQVT